jgi:hypothetical protein
MNLRDQRLIMVLATGSIIVLLLVLLSGQFEPPPQPEPNLTSPTPFTSDGRTILFFDDFSQPSPRWNQLVDDYGITDFEYGGYHVKVNVPNQNFVATPGLAFDQNGNGVRVDAFATLIDTPNDTTFGLICGYENAANFRIMFLRKDGYYGIAKYQGGAPELIGMAGLLPTDALNPDGVNYLSAICKNTTITFFLNNQLLITVQDNAEIIGEVGFLAGSGTGGYADVLFDNFLVSIP